jgi:alkylated DNA repair protein alkB family protein 1
MKAPLISLSFGSSAIFLIGGQSKFIKPKAICISSGDVVVMSGESRLAYHAVPKIYKNNDLNLILNLDSNEIVNEWTDYYNYIINNRINLNIRQVFD